MEGRSVLKREDLLFPELSYKISGVIFEVYKQLGGGHPEKYYQKAIAIGFKRAGINFKEQYYVPLKFNGELVGKYYLDFLIEEKIILELKRGKFVPFKIIDQVKQYLESLELQLALIACFTHEGALVKRIIQIKQST